MKLTACLLIVACMHVSANSYSQTVSFSGKNVSLQAVFASIEKQTGFSFFFNYALIKDIKPVTLEVVNVPMEMVLKEVLNGLGLDFYQTGKTVFIVKTQRKEPLERTNTPFTSNDDRQVDIKGRVSDSQGQGLAGASVSVKKGNKGTMTDEKGTFELKNISVGAVLEISYAGYQKREVLVDVNGLVNVQLIMSSSQLDEMQVIAYGQTNQRMSVGDVTTIKAIDIEKQPVNNPLLALEGRVPGMFISQSSGLSGTGVKVQIRGQSNINTAMGNDPFYVIDGIPYISQLLPGLNTSLGSSGAPNGAIVGSPLNFINPSDIESISVLKDADATAIYGSRAANGAILITTKKGKIGRTNLDVNLQTGWGGVGRKLDVMNNQQYLEMRHEGVRNDGLTIQPNDYDINGTWDSTRHTDWQKELIGGTARYNNANLNFSGGTTALQYLIGSTYHKETTVFPGDFSDVKASIHFSINNISANQKFRILLTGNYLIDNNQLPQTDLTNLAISLSPIAPAQYINEGLNWAPTVSGTSTWANPLAGLMKRYTNKTNNLIANSFISYQILNGLTFATNFGYTNLQSTETSIYPLAAVAPEARATSSRSANFGYNNINSWVVEPEINFKGRILKGLTDVVLGTTINQINSNGLLLSGSKQASDQVLYDLRSATTVTASGTSNSVYKYNAVFARIAYNWDSRYLINLAARRDGSSRFGTANQFHDFGSIGIGWIFSNEDFVHKLFSILSFGKFRGSYGITGNDQIGDYKFMNLYNSKSYQVPYQGITSLVPNGLTNPYLQWQSTKKIEGGLDLGFFRDRILMNASYFQNRCSNQLLNYPLPTITGFQSIVKNLPATVQNSGWEFILKTTNIKRKSFSWQTSINFSTSKNQLISYPNLGSSGYFIIGQPINYYRAYHFMGVNPNTGIYQFADGKGGTTSSPDTNVLNTQSVIIKTAPSFFGGILNSFQFKGISLDLFFQFVKQRAPNYFFGALMPGAFLSGQANQPTWLLDRWKAQGNVSQHQKYTSGFSYYNQWNDANQSDAAYPDASYIRLKNISLSWQLPDKWKAKSKLQNARIYLQAQNLLTFTHYKGLDPENFSPYSLPPLRVFTCGFQMTL